VSLQRLITSARDLEDEIRQHVIEVRGYLVTCGYREVVIYKEARNGLVYCALWELVEVPPHASLGIGYGRVSQEVQSKGHSLSTQVRHELELAAQRGHVLRYLYIDAGVTGRDDRRPAFSRMMRRAVQGDVTAVYCYDIQRFYRNLHGLTTYVGILQEHDVALISTADRNTDFSSGDGKLLMYIKGIISERYLDDLSRTTRDNKLSRAMQGRSNAAWPPLGYCRGNCLDCTDPNGKGYCPRFGGPDLWRELSDDPQVFVPHPIEQVALQLAAKWYATGLYSDTDITRMLNDYRLELADGESIPLQPKGRPGAVAPERKFYKDAVRDMLQNPYYAGLILYREMRKVKGQRFQGGKRLNPYSQSPDTVNGHETADSNGLIFPGLHIPLIELDLFERCLQVRGARGYLPRSDVGHTARIYPLSGLLRCGRCEGTMRGTAAHGDVRYYEDVNRVQGASDCPVRSVRAEGLEEVVFAHVQQLRIPDEWHPGILAYLQDSDEGRGRRRQQRSLESQLRVVQEEHRRGEISNSDYTQTRRRLEGQLQQLARREQAGREGPTALLADFSRLWAVATPLERKTLLRCIFLDVHVQDGQVTGYTPRDPFIPLFPAT
jgi:DNA invertase Pin-like site-specific DNA recombinase